MAISQAQLENIIGNIRTVHKDNILLDKLTDPEIFHLLAYEMWKDGCDDWDMVNDLTLGIYLPFNTRELASNQLINVFGYKNSNPVSELIDIIQKYLGGRVTDCGGDMNERCYIDGCKKYAWCKRNYDFADALDNLKNKLNK
jgi:hypothetical protein